MVSKGRAPGRPRGLSKTGGRKKGTPNKATADVRALAEKYGPKAIAELARLATKAKSEATRVAAIRELLDRAYGRPGQPLKPAALPGCEFHMYLDSATVREEEEKARSI